MDPVGTLELGFPFAGRWRTENSPASRIPSHGTTAFGSSHAIDFVMVDERGRSAPYGWRTPVATEPAEIFLGHGAPILAPVAGEVVAVHDGEPDHEARRSRLLLIGYALTQGRRATRGIAGLAGNHVVLAAGGSGPYVVLAQLRPGSPRVRAGERVTVGQALAACGNSGNSTEPHVHVQASDSLDFAGASGVPIVFRATDGRTWLPATGEIVLV